jgi:multiple antibiotic resistance protein
MGAINRILGFLILAIAVQFIADGTFDLLTAAAPKWFQ